jgi:hypothetical protein
MAWTVRMEEERKKDKGERSGKRLQLVLVTGKVVIEKSFPRSLDTRCRLLSALQRLANQTTRNYTVSVTDLALISSPNSLLASPTSYFTCPSYPFPHFASSSRRLCFRDSVHGQAMEFHYEPLEHESHIRLVHLFPEDNDSEGDCCTLVHHHLETAPSYEALSIPGARKSTLRRYAYLDLSS